MKNLKNIIVIVNCHVDPINKSAIFRCAALTEQNIERLTCIGIMGAPEPRLENTKGLLALQS